MDAPGRPMLYVTTDKFLRVFGLNALDELPETEALSVAAAQAESESTEQTDPDQMTIENMVEVVSEEYTEPVDTEEADVIFEGGVPDTQDKKEEPI